MVSLNVRALGGARYGSVAGGRNFLRPPLVLLHAFPLDSRMWLPVAAAMPDVPVLAIDLPGFGLSPRPSRFAGIRAARGPDLSWVAWAVLDALSRTGVTRFALGGLSLGGYVAMAMLRQDPDAIAGLALLDTKATADTDEARANRLAMADRVEADDSADAVAGMPATLLSPAGRVARPDLVDEMAGWLDEAAPDAIAWTQRAMAARPDSSDVLAEYTRPAVVVVGEQDEITPVAAARQMARALSHSELTVIPGAGHLSALEDPAAVAAALTRLWLRSVEPLAPARDSAPDADDAP